jgi:hypothetical protein
MIGAAILIAVMVLVLPPLIFVVGMVGSALLGWALQDEAVRTHEGSPYIDLNR